MSDEQEFLQAFRALPYHHRALIALLIHELAQREAA